MTISTGTLREPWTITTSTGTLREPWAITTSTGTLSESWSDYYLNWNAERILDVFYWDKNQGDLRVDLTEPEKVFD